jgi:hypothetical protein
MGMEWFESVASSDDFADDMRARRWLTFQVLEKIPA